MKKIFTFILFLFLIGMGTSSIAQVNTINIRSKGRISPNAENENNETDPPFQPITFKTIVPKRGSATNNQTQVSKLENGLQMVRDILNRMMNNEYGFSLLSSHKYMINNCLGFKVSAGSFNLRFEKPSVTMNNIGKLTIRLEVDEIKLSAFKLRMRPCTKLEHIADACHFGPKFEVGGEATDLVMTATLDLVTNAIAGTDAFCFLSFNGGLDINWKIGGLNLRPMQNNLDNLGKDMLEDALNGGMVHWFYNKFIDMSREVMPQYYAHCENAYNITNMVEDAANVVVNTAENNMGNSDNDNNNNNSTDTEKWMITSNNNVRGALGRLNTQFPPGVDWSVDIRSAADKFLTNRSGYSKHGPSHDLPPGNYIFRLNTIPVLNVPIEKGKETRLKTGVLNIVSTGNWHIYDETQKKYYTSGNKPKKMALPVGRYQVKFNGQFMEVVMKDGEEFEL